MRILQKGIDWLKERPGQERQVLQLLGKPRREAWRGRRPGGGTRKALGESRRGWKEGQEARRRPRSEDGGKGKRRGGGTRKALEEARKG